MNEQIIIAMKPLDKNFVDNALDRGVAGINIDGSRIDTLDDRSARYNGKPPGGTTASFQYKDKKNKVWNANKGRFPANIILQHHEECKKIGTKKVKSDNSGNERNNAGFNPVGTKLYGKGKGKADRIGYAVNGKETIEEWNCHPDCPIRIIDEQSGTSISTGGSGEKSVGAMGDRIYGKYNKKLGAHSGGLGDTGGASRFYYQVKKIDESTNIEENSMEVNNLFNEDCKITMRRMDENSIPFIITDPPYLLEFMGKEFDSQHHSQEGDNIGQKMQKWHSEWLIEAYRVLKPGGYLVAFGGTRTYHRLACAMEDVGFQIRDTMQWIYGSGFPKSLNISKGIDKRKGADREVIGENIRLGDKKAYPKNPKKPFFHIDNISTKGMITKSSTDEAKKWDGWGTALKPAYEPIVIGMKPVNGSFVDNALNEGVAGINIDASRVATDKSVDDMLRKVDRNERQSKQWRDGSGFKNEHNELTGVREDGRFPANVILQHHEECKKIGTKKVKGGNDPRHLDGTKSGHACHNGGWKHGEKISHSGFSDKDGMETIEEWNCHADCPVRIMNEQSKDMGMHSPGNVKETTGGGWTDKLVGGKVINPLVSRKGFNDSGGAARFYYTAKASKSERNLGLEGMEKKKSSKMGDGIVSNVGPGLTPGETESGDREAENFHPTVKPLDLMRYLVNMFSTPDGGVVYDPFTGSGSTLIACKILGREYIGSEMEPEYYEIAKKRLQYDWKTWWERGKKDDFVPVKREKINKFFE